MAGQKNHDYHILPPSVWPVTGALGAIVMLGGAVLWFHDHGPWISLIGFVIVLYTMWSWWVRSASSKTACPPSKLWRLTSPARSNCVRTRYTVARPSSSPLSSSAR